MVLNYDYTNSKTYCEQIGLYWLGDDFQPLVNADAAAKAADFTQAQVDVAMMHHLYQIKLLFTPKSYKYLGRLKIAFLFLTGIDGKKGK